MNKRITSLFLSVVMICSLLVTAVPAWAAPGDSGVTASVTQAAPGDTFSVTLKLPGTERLISDISLKVHFDSAVFEVTEYTIPSIPGMEKMQSNVEEANSNAFFAAVYLSLNSEADIPFTDGLEVTAYFKVKADASLGDSEFKLDNSTSVASLTDMGLPDVLVKYDDFVNKSATIKVVGAPIPATGITLNPTELSMTVGDTKPLTATVTPADATDTVVWSTNDDTVATVDASGSVTAVGAGETTITATAGSVYATCTVKVAAAPCIHDYGTLIAEENATCSNTGMKAHYQCSLCGAYFDEDKTEKTLADLTIPVDSNAHNFDMSEWGYQGDDGHAHVCTHNSAHHDTVEAHNFGSDDICDICGYERTHVCANHLTKVEEKLADCTNPGNIEHYKCSCGKLYEDATAAVELTEDQVKRDALGHDWIDATCTEPKTCDRCGETEGTALGHNWATEWSSNADNHWHACTRCDAKDGEGAHNPGAPATETTPQICTDCGYVIESATGHECLAGTLTKVEAKPADCTNPGNKEHYKCECGNLYKDADALVPTDLSEVTIAALGHDWKDATCTTPKTCDRCHTIEGEALGHNWATEWSSNETKHWHDCSRCDAKNDEADHTPDRAEATETDPIKCTVCDYVITPATGHVCASHLTKVEAKPADCINPGNKAYYKCECGKFFEDADALTEIIDHGSVVTPALDHDWAGEWSSDETNHWHACTRCDAKNGEAAHNPGPEATEDTPQTCTECGYVIAPATGGGSSGGGGSSVSTYAITVKDAKNGDVSANRKSASKGTTITLTVTPDKGYVLDTIKVLDSKDNAIKLTEKDSKFTFIMPGSKVTVEATFKAETPDNPFTDVPEGSYYEDAVIWAVGKGVTGGTSATTFTPDGICTRAQAVTFLWRAAGSPAPKSSAMPFTDVKAGSDYYDAVLWAVEQGITAGTSATTFAPDLNCSRAQIVTFLYRAAGSPAVSGSPAFSDVASDAYYAKAVKWAQANGITSGIGGGLFGSNDNCTRAQIVTFIYRYMEK